MYQVVIGLEVHCALNTKAKVFSSAKNTYSDIPNSNLSVVDLGFPGIMPELNKAAVDKVLRLALALHCEIPQQLLFDRKNYFYPDLTKGYQITQAAYPMGENGYLMMNVNEIDKKVLIHDIHLEEDTASLEHHENYSLIDYNRAGVPLVEIVTEPCLASAEEAYAYLDTLRGILIYTNTSDARGDLGQMRCDVNVSLKKEADKQLGTKVEIKNINSFNYVKEAIAYEVKRQGEMLDNGETIIQETRRFDDTTHTTISMRSKVEAVDYKYYTEPNLPPIVIDEVWKESLCKEIPLLQFDRVNKYINDYDLSRFDANILVKDKVVAEYFEQGIDLGGNPKSLANWINGSIMAYINKNNDANITNIYMTPQRLVALIKLVDDGKISSKQAKEVINIALEEQKDLMVIIKEKGMEQIGDDTLIRDIVIKAIAEKMELVEEYKKGRNVLDYFVGQVMKQTRGQANPSLTRQIVEEEIQKH